MVRIMVILHGYNDTLQFTNYNMISISWHNFTLMISSYYLILLIKYKTNNYNTIVLNI